MSSEFSIKVENLSKCYHVYDRPGDRLKQFFLPRLRGMVGVDRGQNFREFWALRDVSFEVKRAKQSVSSVVTAAASQHYCK